MSWDHKTRRRQRGGVKFAVKPSVSRNVRGAKPVAAVSKSAYPKTLGKKSKSVYRKSVATNGKSRGLKVIKVKHFFKAHKLDTFVKGIESLLNIYTYASRISERNRHNIFEFLMIVNEHIRKAAMSNEGFLHFYFKNEEDKDTLAKVVDTSHATVDNISKKVKECISFLSTLSKKRKDENDAESKKELISLVSTFESAIITSVQQVKLLVLEKRANRAAGAGAPNDPMAALINAFGGLDMKKAPAAGADDEEMKEKPDPGVEELAAALKALGV
jgi:hypothetical protein